MKIRNRFLNRCAVRVATLLLRGLYKSCRSECIVQTPNTNPYINTDGERYLYSIWHDQLLMAIFTRKPQSMAGLVSKHSDGSYLSDSMELLGIKPVRGSSSRGGAQAMREMMEVAEDWHIAITPDGPRGPRRELKLGLIYLASRSGRSILPIAYLCNRAWKLQGSWTDMMLPKPFTKIWVASGEPMHVPENISKEEMESYRLELQSQMEKLEIELEALKNGKTVKKPEAEPMKQAA